MYFSTALVFASLPFLVAAVPFEGGSRDGIAIPIAKRTGFRNADGVVDIPKLQAGQQRTVAKIQHGFEAFERNTGSAHPCASQQMRTNKRGRTDLLVADSAAGLWYGPISVGTPPVTYTVSFDTGSSDLFLPGSDCDATCNGHILYDPEASSTSSNVGRRFELKYGDGSIVMGDQYTDTVTLAGYMATGQRIGEANIYSSEFWSDHFPADGIIGLGFEPISTFRASPVFQTLVSQGQVSTPVFSFYFAKSGSELYIGGTNQNLYKGSFTYMPVTTQGYWQGSFDGVSVNGKAVIGRENAIIDTGSTQVLGDIRKVQALYNQIHGSQYAGSGIWTIPCDFNKTVSIKFSGEEFPISASTFNLGPVFDGSDDCLGGFGAIDGPGFWVVGDVFLQNVYTAFDFGNSSVGFASLRLA